MNKEVLGYIEEKIAPIKMSVVNEGASEANVYFCVLNQGNCYIKIQSIDELQLPLLKEKNIYEWLNGQILVPKVIFYDTFDHYEILCITELKGSKLEEINDPKKIVKAYAEGLRALHNLPTEACEYKIDIDEKIKEAKTRIENDLIDVEDFEEIYKEYSPLALYDKMITLKPNKYKAVFTHGDYCLDNVIWSEPLGVIDIGNGGLSDPYQDITLALRSIDHTFGKQYQSFFLECYGLNELDEKRVEFYLILDEFF